MSPTADTKASVATAAKPLTSNGPARWPATGRKRSNIEPRLRFDSVDSMIAVEMRADATPT